MEVRGSKPVEKLLKEKKIFEIINKKLVKASPEITVEQAIQLMQENRSGYVVLAKEKKPIGIFTENDVLFKILEKNVNWDDPVSKYMTPNPLVLTPEASVGEAIDMMGERRFYHIPLVDEKGDLVNVISVRTLIRFLAEFYPTEVYNLPPRNDQIMPTREGG